MSRYTADVVRRSFGADARVEVVPGGFTAPMRQPPAASRQPPAAVPRILSVGALKKRKGFHTLIAALERLAREGMSPKCDLVGGTGWASYVSRLKDQISAGHLEDQVHIRGQVDDRAMADLYARADLFVMASEHDGPAFEGLGLVYLEAMSYGVPVIGARESGAEDVIRDGENGLLVPPANPAALAAAIRKVLTDQALRRKMALAAPASIAPFAWDVVGEKMAGVYRRLTAARDVNRK